MKDIIEISSSEEEDALSKPVTRRRPSSLSAMPTPDPAPVGPYSGNVHEAESEVERLPSHWHPKSGPAGAHARRIVHSSSSPESPSTNAKLRPNNADISVIEITDSSDDDNACWRRPMSPPVRPPCQDQTNGRANPLPASDDGLLVLDEPKSSRKPLRRPQTPETARRGPPSAGDKGAPSLVQAFSSLSTLTESDLENTPPMADDPAPITSLFRVPAHTLPTAPSTPTPKTPATKARAPKFTTPSAAKTPRTSKKALALAEQAERAAYAQSLFDDLNLSVFGGGLPATTTLVWSNRLLTTAGRARWRRSKEGVHTTSIELATKILDSNERIRNTLSHEMCHLACWVINQDPKEGHGKVWKSWAAKVMRKRADIDISTRHNYEISYPFEWECENCAKTYGRFSKSIRPDEVVCGACKIGTLRPLFTVRTKTPRKTANSQMAARSPRDSPRAVGNSPITIDDTTSGTRMMPGSFDDDSEEFDLDELSLGIRRLGVKDN
ncbi:SprT-like family-domain-containing protein [Lactarius akahatsu]|uniref:SprT-like family-domain-containing protein n=1 Tax=Lactarius akahatsu TaxID=416441 RepID=A0AAD4LH31_9AGAM|nr:SprT-like family-domain-containing protein [Lactarius akahatsu]